MLVSRMSLHTAVTREPRATSPLQGSDRLVGHLEHWFVQQSIPEEPSITNRVENSILWSVLKIFVPKTMNLLQSWTFLTPGALIILCFDIWSCAVLHSKGHGLLHNISTVVPSRERERESDGRKTNQVQQRTFPEL